jgi:hypothetical protein
MFERNSDRDQATRGPWRNGFLRAVCVVGSTTLGLLSLSTAAGATAPSRAAAPNVSAISAAVHDLGSTVVAGKAATSVPHSISHAVDPICTFNGTTGLVTNVTPGSSISIVCSGWTANDQVLAAQSSPLFLNSGSSNDIDGNVQTFTSDGAGNLAGTFVVPATFTAADPAAVCPPTPAQVAEGFLRCFVVLTDSGGSGDAVALNYSAPAPPAGATAVGIASTPDGGGYWVGWSNGSVTVHGDALLAGDASALQLNQPIAHIVSTPSGDGYWLVAADGGTFTFGDAGFYGSMGGKTLNKPVVDIAPTGDGGGYWLAAADGGIFSFGDAGFDGSMGGIPLNKPVVGIAADDATGGYWEVASDGGIFSFGNAPFFGSTGGTVLNKPINGMATTPGDDGYWLVASDGGIFSFGAAQFHGSMGGQPLNQPVVGMAADPATGGYWLVAADGGIFSFGAPFYGAG